MDPNITKNPIMSSLAVKLCGSLNLANALALNRRKSISTFDWLKPSLVGRMSRWYGRWEFKKKYDSQLKDYDLRDPGEYLLMNRRRGRILLRSSSETLRGVDSVRDRLLLHALLYARQWGGLLFSDFCVIAAGQGPKMRGNEW